MFDIKENQRILYHTLKPTHTLGFITTATAYLEYAVGSYVIKSGVAQHYLLSAKSHNLSLKQIFRLSEDEALKMMKGARWGSPDNTNDVCCLHCNIRHHAYFLASRKRWCCKHCKRHFYITTNTASAFHKLSLVDLLAAIALFLNNVKGIAATTMISNLDVQYKTAYLLCQKLREVLFKTRDLSPLQGEIHKDGAWINFKLRKPNFRKNRHKQQDKKMKFPKFRPIKRCIINFSQRASNDENLWGSNRTLVAMDYSESANTTLAMNHKFIKQDSDIFCDEDPAYSGLDFHYTRGYQLPRSI